MTPAVTIDLRGYEFETMHELVGLVQDMLPVISNEYPAIHAVVISEHHLKMLRLERYMQGEPIQVVKKSGPESVCGLPVIIALQNGTFRCPGCGGIHDTDVLWYHER